MPTASLFRLVMGLKRKCLATEERIRSELKLTPGEFNGLLSIAPGERIQGAAFAERLGISASRGSRVTGMLARRGLASIEHDVGDRRSISVTLTPDGEAAREDIERRLAECERKLLSAFSHAQAAQIRSALSLLEHAL